MKNGKNYKKIRNSENKIMYKMKIFLDCEWWDNFCVWNGLRLGQIEFVKKKKRFLGYEETKQKLIIKRK
jgi:hypothetical protein